ncbi:hydrolase [Geojedonia litorea]|uniref:Hydrolase n=2 Tax=Geojedonia litorea TaxID=1268269 RepID=A0ABV9N3F4_9FLAO
MKRNIFMYLFIFTLLLVLFQFMNSKHIIEDYDKKLTTSLAKENTYKDSILTLKDNNFELMRFSIEFNDDAMSYFEDQGYRISELVPFIKDELYKLNVYEGEDHPLVPYASMTGNKMLINSVRLLNHKWIIADFSDGKYWGEMLLTYEIVDKQELKFKLLDYLLYH